MTTKWMLVLALSGLVAGCGSVQDVKGGAEAHAAGRSESERHHGDDEDGGEHEGEHDDEVEVALDQVPAAIRDAALAAVPGLVLTGAEQETEEGSLHYCLAGTVAGEPVEVEVRASDAAVVEIERGEDED